jgi:LysR family hydrogen peroxide-inducible transcriptional activator
MSQPSLRQLEYVVALAETLSFRRAAEACHVSQPALSAQVQQLEEQLGVTLFERDRRRVLLTGPGRELVGRARTILGLVAEVVRSARADDDPLSGTLRLGVIPTVAPYVLPRAIASAHREHPRLRILLREEQTARLVDLLAAGSLDVLLLALQADLGSSEARPLFEDPFRLVVPDDHRLARRRRVRHADLDGEQVLLLDDGHCLREQVLPLCREAGARELGNFRASSLGTLVQMVATGLGITLVPELALATEPLAELGLVAVPFARPVPSRTIGLAWRPTSTRKPALELLAGHLAPPAARAARRHAAARRTTTRRGRH